MSSQYASGFTGYTGHHGGGERVIYQDPTVTITTARAMLGGVTYAMANITSVRQFVEPAERAGLIFLGIIGLIVALIANSLDAGPFAFLCLIGSIGLFSLAWRLKAKHWVRIGTAGAETNAVWSHDPMWTSRIVVAMNEAIIARG